MKKSASCRVFVRNKNKNREKQKKRTVNNFLRMLRERLHLGVGQKCRHIIYIKPVAAFFGLVWKNTKHMSAILAVKCELFYLKYNLRNLKVQ